jgi:hypothetical protein
LSAIALSIVSLIATIVLGAGAEGPMAGSDTKEASQRVMDIVNRNEQPKLAHRTRDAMPSTVAVFSETYDWKEEQRVHQALDKLYDDTSEELWEELVRKAGDQRYCIVIVSPVTEDAIPNSVGAVCADLAYCRLVSVCRQHLPKDPATPGRPPALFGFVDRLKLQSWRKSRAEQSLYQLQVEVCERVLSELPTVKGVPQAEKDLAFKKIEAEIKELRIRKQPLVGKLRFCHELTYEAKSAERVRKALMSGSEDDIRIIH